jgi:hypothetical protein
LLANAGFFHNSIKQNKKTTKTQVNDLNTIKIKVTILFQQILHSRPVVEASPSPAVLLLLLVVKMFLQLQMLLLNFNSIHFYG